jgi:hypothetical protein
MVLSWASREKEMSAGLRRLAGWVRLLGEDYKLGFLLFKIVLYILV